MSSEVKLRQKLNKKIKLAFGKADNREEAKVKFKRTTHPKEAHGGDKDVRKSRTLIRGEKDHLVDHDARRSGVDQKINHEPANFDRKRKRVYASQVLNGTGDQNGNVSAKREQTRAKDSVDKRKLSGQPPRTIWLPTMKDDVSSKVKRAGPKFKSRKGRMEEYDGKSTKLKVNDHRNDAGTGMLKKHAKIMEESRKVPEKKRLTGFGDTTPQNTVRKIRKEKAMADDGMEDRPKRKKRVIRLDPYDISNKRLDDGLATSESSQEKKKELEANVGMSKNAQFRAIKPSASILTYVEDNLLGRRRSIELQRAGYNIELSAPLDNIPSSTSSERERIEESVFRNKLTFFAAAKVSSSFPPPGLPEIAFAGRSNVGKSSLLNSLTRQWGVARTSEKPGLTQTINFFELGSKLCLVDLPGYGFAYAKEEVKDAWEDLVKEYVSTRVGLKRVCLLVDTKWGMKPRDLELIHLMERSQTKYQVLLTKTDLVFPIDVARRAMQIEETLKANKSLVQPVVMVSSKTGAGIRSLRTVLSKIARFAKV